MQEETLQLDVNEQIAQRRSKLNALRQTGNAFPNDFRKDAFAADLLAQYAQWDETALEKLASVKIAGRMVARRLMGKASFAHIQDMTGRIQLYIKQEIVSEALYETFKHWDLGDIIAA